MLVMNKRLAEEVQHASTQCSFKRCIASKCEGHTSFIIMNSREIFLRRTYRLSFHFILFSYNLGRVALQLVLVSKGPSIYFTIYLIIPLKTKLKHIMNKIYRNT